MEHLSREERLKKLG